MQEYMQTLTMYYTTATIQHIIVTVYGDTCQKHIILHL